MEPGATQRFAFTVQYDGGAFFGWQLQRGQVSVQGELERVLSRLLDRPVRVLGSGRTDRGVHAVGQVATADVSLRWTPENLRRAMNALLPAEIWISEASRVPGDFHPRYDAIVRSYVYRLGTAGLTASPFHSRWCWPIARPVDLGAMAEATAALPGEHSFRAFAKAGQEERGDRCRVTQAEWREWDLVGVEFHITANRFLHHMVRYLVGTLVEIGLGRRDVGDVERLLMNPKDIETSPPAPPEGLFLLRVSYPPELYDPETLASGLGSLPQPIR